MRERPVIFSGPMVRAILAGTKTQTRRVLREQAESYVGDLLGQRFIYPVVRGTAEPVPIRCPYGQPGDRLWVRETWSREDVRGIMYRATDKNPSTLNWKPSIHMHRADSRLTLELTEVRVQRLLQISEEDAEAEGVEPVGWEGHAGCFAALWDSINAKRGHSWASNPWVWALTFRRVA